MCYYFKKQKFFVYSCLKKTVNLRNVTDADSKRFENTAKLVLTT